MSLDDFRGYLRRYRIPLIFYLLTMMVDVIAIIAGLGTVVALREYAVTLGLTRSPEAGFVLRNFEVVSSYYTVAIILLFHYVDVYRDRRFLSGKQEAGRIFRITILFGIFNGLLSYLFPTRLLFSRPVLFLGSIFIPLLIIILRHILGYLRSFLRRYGGDIRNAMIIGEGELLPDLADELTDTWHHGFRLEAIISDSCGSFASDGVECCTDYSRIEELVAKHNIHEVFICAPGKDAENIVSLFKRLRPLGVRVRLVGNLYDNLLLKIGVPVDSFKDVSILDFGTGIPHPIQARFKRLFDITFASVFILLFSPLFLIIYLAVYLESGNPVIFRQRRVRQEGKPFLLYKFRSMRVDAEDIQDTLNDCNEIHGPMFKMRNDPRVTRVGRVLRRYSFDELPQLINVLKGDISLVGPRPPLPEEVENYREWHWKRLLHPMGLTGLWQVSGRNRLSFEEMTLLDIYYNRNPSLCIDLRILLKTAGTVILREGY